MSSVFIKTLKPFMVISKMSGLISFCCLLNTGLMIRNNTLSVYLFVEMMRMFLFLLPTCWMFSLKGLYFFSTLLIAIKYWSIVIAARTTEKWLIRFDIVLCSPLLINNYGLLQRTTNYCQQTTIILTIVTFARKLGSDNRVLTTA